MWHAWDRVKISTGFWSEELKERENLEDLGVDGRIILKYILQK
jgi:hypothetical protein